MLSTIKYTQTDCFPLFQWYLSMCLILQLTYLSLRKQVKAVEQEKNQSLDQQHKLIKLPSHTEEEGWNKNGQECQPLEKWESHTY